MPRNDPNDLQPPLKYKIRRVPRPLTMGEVKAAADRAEARAMRTQLMDDPPNPNPQGGVGSPEEAAWIWAEPCYPHRRQP